MDKLAFPLAEMGLVSLGLLNAPTHFFGHSEYPSPLAGKGLIVGCDNAGESRSCKTTVEEVKAKVSFSNIFQIRARYA